MLGLPGANGQKWFVFHVSRPDETHEEAFFITVRAIVDTSKVSRFLQVSVAQAPLRECVRGQPSPAEWLAKRKNAYTGGPGIPYRGPRVPRVLTHGG